MYVRIKNNPILAALDFGAAVSVISKRLLDKLGLMIDEESFTVVVIATGAKSKTLERVKNVKIAIRDIVIPITLQVLES